MTTGPHSQAATSADFLFAGQTISAALQDSGAADAVREKLSAFTLTTRDEAVREVERVSAELLDLNLVDVLLEALTRYDELRAAGQRTASAPDSRELVELIAQQLVIDSQPSIDLLVDNKHVATVRIRLSLIIDIQALTAVVRHGRLTALQVGQCDAEASVSIEGTSVARQRARLLLPASLPVGAGIPLTGGPERPAQSPRAW